ncbi:hypothetical protein HII31_07700 [Pseudocercospora fuligena]|uniref:Uncharacterized protein n=1 Tax=Pseudocercospora fuligena TaxID=685502 RepID=A0A8H6VLB9_9PEZI|nr:hypothetical protein HII31_07700 [Pseudocercospora fuligena]
MHHRFDDSPDDYDMDMDQRTRMLGRGGRIILLGDGTEILTGHSDQDGDIDMEDRVQEVEEVSSEEQDDEQLRRDQKPNGAEDRNSREETPAPSATATGNDLSSKAEESKQRLTSTVDPKTTTPTDTDAGEKSKEETK